MASTPAGDFRQPLQRKPAAAPVTLRDHPCAAPGCDDVGIFGLGPPIQPQAWWCARHKPADFYTRRGR